MGGANSYPSNPQSDPEGASKALPTSQTSTQSKGGPLTRAPSTQNTATTKGKVSGKTSTEWRTRSKQSFALEVKVDEDIIRKGVLSRKGKQNKMKKFYCVLLASGLLKCYHPKSLQEVATLKVYNCVNVKPVINGTNPKDTTTKRFEVTTVKRVWEFEADTETDATEWINAISSLSTNSNAGTRGNGSTNSNGQQRDTGTTSKKQPLPRSQGDKKSGASQGQDKDQTRQGGVVSTSIWSHAKSVKDLSKKFDVKYNENDVDTDKRNNSKESIIASPRQRAKSRAKSGKYGFPTIESSVEDDDADNALATEDGYDIPNSDVSASKQQRLRSKNRRTKYAKVHYSLLFLFDHPFFKKKKKISLTYVYIYIYVCVRIYHMYLYS
ncbi:hypothetical protein RFI_14423 [Reticulomyxa filosa]|uniref:PH domain-containing protein n=1 Tax=Reticulomyxa filosa TaxID=46433 RepID=X6N8Z9_RETFI|nr:hypothetical protein RFI_14423 [Reticulomyxa filosa]|eukprot:ETO22770.1 hypothetical protein RFI_14423 [Reticulomyxa filosa]